MEITKRTEYAIRALMELALQSTGKPGVYIQTKEIAARRAIPEKLLPQIISALNRQGWVEGTRGPSGGVRLAVEPSSITVLDVLELIEGPLALNSCLSADSPCPSAAGCSLQRVWGKAQGVFQQVLAEVSIANLIESDFSQ